MHVVKCSCCDTANQKTLYVVLCVLVQVSFKLILVIWQFEDAAKEVADEVTRPRPSGEDDVQDIQIMLRSDSNAVQVRQLKVYDKQ